MLPRPPPPLTSLEFPAQLLPSLPYSLNRSVSRRRLLLPARLPKCHTEKKKKDPHQSPTPPPHSIFSYVNSHFPPEQTHFPRLRPATLHSAPPTSFLFTSPSPALPGWPRQPGGEMKSTRHSPARVCHDDRASFIIARFPRVSSWKLGSSERLRRRLAPSLVNIECHCAGDKRQPATALSQIKALICIYCKHRLS